MKKGMMVALLLSLAMGARGAEMKNVLADGETFYTGCNYWASHAGMYMWRNWEPQTVEKDLAALAKNGVNMLRVFPLWSDFQPLTRLLGARGTDYGVSWNDKPLLNPAGVDEEMMRRFRFMCDVAKKHDIKLVVGLITGWMSGRLFVPPAFETQDLLRDPEVVMWQVRYVRHFVRELKDHPAIAAWNLGNECNCLASKEMTAYESWLWMNTIASAIRLEDATRPVVSGMHACSNARDRRWNLHIQGELMDELTTHPYPLFVPHCATDPYDTMRSETHPTAESLFYWGVSGKHCFVEEAGDLGPCTASPERSAANARCAMFTAWANGLGAYVWWCAFDQDHLDFPPYTWVSLERELGLFTKDHEPKPVLKAMGAFRKFLDSLPPEIAKLPPRQVDAVVLVSDRVHAWAGSFGAFLLARQAGFDVVFANAEKLPLPPAKLYILPALGGSDSYSHAAWQAALDRAAAGATLLISKGGDARYSGFLQATGNEIDVFCKQGVTTKFELKDFPGRVIEAADSTRTEIVPKRSTVLGASSQGRAMVTVQPYGKGKVVYCNFPIENDSVLRSDCFYGSNPNPRYLVYKTAAKEAGIVRKVEKSLPGVGLTEHPLQDGRTIVVAVNYEPSPAVCPITVKGRITTCWNGSVADGALRLPANDAMVFLVEAR